MKNVFSAFAWMGFIALLQSNSFAQSPGTFIRIPTLGGDSTSVQSLNDTGVSVGGTATKTASHHVTHTHAFYYDTKIHDIGTLGGDFSFAYDINSTGQIVGSAAMADGIIRAFSLTGGKKTGLGALSRSGWSVAYSVNDAGHIVGESQNDCQNEAFLYANGKMVGLGYLPNGYFSAAYAINNSDLIVGVASNSKFDSRAISYSQSAGMIDLGTLGGDNAIATAVNNSGEIVGSSETSHLDGRGHPIEHAFLITHGQMIDLGDLGGGYSKAWGINDSGVIVGESTNANIETVPFIYSNGTMSPLVTATTSFGYACDINASGEVVGLIHDETGRYSFLYKP